MLGGIFLTRSEAMVKNCEKKSSKRVKLPLQSSCLWYLYDICLFIYIYFSLALPPFLASLFASNPAKKELVLLPHLRPAAADSWKATFGWSWTTLLPTGSCKSVFPTSWGDQHLGSYEIFMFFNLFGVVCWIVCLNFIGLFTLVARLLFFLGGRIYIKTRTFDWEVVQICKNVNFLRGKV